MTYQQLQNDRFRLSCPGLGLLDRIYETGQAGELEVFGDL